MNQKSQHPLYRGYFATYNKSWEKSYVDTGSLKFLSLMGKIRKCWAFSIFFTYDVDGATEVVFQNGNDRVNFRKLYISHSFPYIRFSSGSRGAYKCLHVYFGRLQINEYNEIFIDNDDPSETPLHVLEIATIAPDIVLDDAELIFDTIAALEPDGKAQDRTEMAVLDQSLKQLERKEKDAYQRQNILKHRILLYAKHFVNHRVAFKTLKIWADTEKMAGRSGLVKDFNAEIANITQPLALGRHGYFPSFSKLDLKLVAQELHGIMRDVGNLGVVAFLNSGTLLGYVRQGKPLEHDDDFDIGIWVDGQTEAAIFENWRRFVAGLRKEYAVTNKGSFLSVRMRNGVQVDMFPAWTIAEKTYIYPYCFADCDDTVLRPFGKMRIEGLDFTVPAQPEGLLAINYGPNWRVPDPYWRFNFDKAQSRFKRVRKLMKTNF